MQTIAYAWLNELLAKAPFASSLGIRVLSSETNAVRVRMCCHMGVQDVADCIHSGAVAALVDFAGTAAAISGIGDTDRVAACATSHLNVTYLQLPDGGAYLDALGKVGHRTSEQVIVDVWVWSDEGRLLAKGTAVCRLFVESDSTA